MTNYQTIQQARPERPARGGEGNAPFNGPTTRETIDKNATGQFTAQETAAIVLATIMALGPLSVYSIVGS